MSISNMCLECPFVHIPLSNGHIDIYIYIVNPNKIQEYSYVQILGKKDDFTNKIHKKFVYLWCLNRNEILS